MFTRMTEVQVLNAISFTDLNWEVVPNKVLTDADEISVIKTKFGVKQDGKWVVRSIFGYELVVEYDNKTGCLEFKIIDPDFGSMMCIPARMATGLEGKIQFEVMVAVDENSSAMVYHLRITTYSGMEVFSKYYVLTNIE